MQTVVLDFDQSVVPPPASITLDLQDWQERVRFGCSVACLRELFAVVERQLPPSIGTVLLGSGDFHHLTWPLVARTRTVRPLQVIVLDNHPDNMRYVGGVHCGSWVRRVARLENVQHVHVVGISSADMAVGAAWQHYLAPLLSGKLTYWTVGVNTSWASRLGLARAFRSFDTPEELVAQFTALQRETACPTYLSIDKDVFAADVVQTNWDQGRLRPADAERIIGSISGSMAGSDITGDISVHRYRSWWKRWLAAADGQVAPDARALAFWQAQQMALTTRLLAAIAAQSGQGPG